MKQLRDFAPAGQNPLNWKFMFYNYRKFVYAGLRFPCSLFYRLTTSLFIKRGPAHNSISNGSKSLRLKMEIENHDLIKLGNDIEKI